MDFSNLLREKGRGVSLPEQQFNMEFYLWVSNMGVVIIILAPQHELIFSFSSTFALPCVQKLSCFCFFFFSSSYVAVVAPLWSGFHAAVTSNSCMTPDSLGAISSFPLY